MSEQFQCETCGLTGSRGYGEEKHRCNLCGPETTWSPSGDFEYDDNDDLIGQHAKHLYGTVEITGIRATKYVSGDVSTVDIRFIDATTNAVADRDFADISLRTLQPL